MSCPEIFSGILDVTELMNTMPSGTVKSVGSRWNGWSARSPGGLSQKQQFSVALEGGRFVIALIISHSSDLLPAHPTGWDCSRHPSRGYWFTCHSCGGGAIPQICTCGMEMMNGS
ncbi:hypothetical protein CEXT_373451 [Caerostris extrusa]|uniref:Uncharacterized protein n=1 Tax=Caerostris extrusa TaxID=172846 RepID=A0AAV4S786_CAEEX|nr:hypothetical protein CEXT_373451 [Caerostris extrusa]